MVFEFCFVFMLGNYDKTISANLQAVSEKPMDKVYKPTPQIPIPTQATPQITPPQRPKSAPQI
jgi:hypothetical protein